LSPGDRFLRQPALANPRFATEDDQSTTAGASIGDRRIDGGNLDFPAGEHGHPLSVPLRLSSVPNFSVGTQVPETVRNDA
jgi:hypothetical protein